MKTTKITITADLLNEIIVNDDSSLAEMVLFEDEILDLFNGANIDELVERINASAEDIAEEIQRSKEDGDKVRFFTFVQAMENRLQREVVEFNSTTIGTCNDCGATVTRRDGHHCPSCGSDAIIG